MGITQNACGRLTTAYESRAPPRSYVPLLGEGRVQYFVETGKLPKILAKSKAELGRVFNITSAMVPPRKPWEMTVILGRAIPGGQIRCTVAAQSESPRVKALRNE